MKRRIEGRTLDDPQARDPRRRLIVIAGGSFALAGAGLVAAGVFPAQTQEPETIMQIYRPGTVPTSKAPESSFTGDVQIGNYYRRAAPSRLVGATATFAPGSRTPWKINPLGQTLIVTSGVGWAQCAGEEIVEIRAGDTVWCPPGARHWEGATPDQAMTYVAVQEEGDAGGIRFVASVTDEEYRKGPPIASPRR